MGYPGRRRARGVEVANCPRSDRIGVCCPLPPPCVGTSDQGKPTSLFHQPIWRLPGVSYPDGDASLPLLRFWVPQEQLIRFQVYDETPEGNETVSGILGRSERGNQINGK